MKTLRALCVAALTATAVFAADALPVFNATLTVGKESRFVLVDASGKASSWLSLGESFAGYTLKSYDAKTSTLELEKGGQTSKVAIAADAAMGVGGTTTPATVAEATAVLEAMNFEKMMDQTLAGVRKQQSGLVNQMMSRMGTVSPEDRDDVVAFQQQVMDTMMAGFTAAEMKDDIAKAYAEIFSKEQLQGLASFYASPLGQTLSEKTPELTQKMNEVMMPRMLANMPKVQQMGQQFAQKMQAKKAAAAAAAKAAAEAGGANAAPAVSPAPAATPAPKP